MAVTSTYADDSAWIAGFEVIPYALAFEGPYVTAPGVLQRREMVLLRVHTSDGLVGLGEAVPLSLRGGRTLDWIVRELRLLRDEFAEATGPGRSEILARAVSELSAPSRCALTTAWLDLGGKSQGLAAWKLLGANEAGPLACNATLTAGKPEEVAEQATAWAQDGYATFKLKLGLANDVEQVGAVREAVGSQAKLRVDANGAWGPEEAISKLEQMAEYEIELAEQPCSSTDELAQVRSQTDVPIAGDESIANRADAERAVEVGACDLATLKLSKVGGPLEAKGVATVISSYMSSALDGPVGIAAGAHTAQALYPTPPDTVYDEHSKGGRDPKLAHGLATQRLFADTITTRECELRDGFLHLPDGPGLGVEIDDAALEQHRL
jgi:L-Ala-D/L-Glu epimerase